MLNKITIHVKKACHFLQYAIYVASCDAGFAMQDLEAGVYQYQTAML